jgi:hypothetical protein
MSTRRKYKSRGMRPFCALERGVFDSPEVSHLTHRAFRALIDLFIQYRGYNNGAFTACWTYMHKRGWRSKSQLRKALMELESRGWIVKTRQGNIRAGNLYAVTFQGIDRCRGMDAGVTPDSMPLHLWRLPQYAGLPVARSQRSVRKRPASHTGRSGPHGGPKVVAFTPPLASTRGQD